MIQAFQPFLELWQPFEPIMDMIRQSYRVDRKNCLVEAHVSLSRVTVQLFRIPALSRERAWHVRQTLEPLVDCRVTRVIVHVRARNTDLKLMPRTFDYWFSLCPKCHQIPVEEQPRLFAYAKDPPCCLLWRQALHEALFVHTQLPLALIRLVQRY